MVLNVISNNISLEQQKSHMNADQNFQINNFESILNF